VEEVKVENMLSKKENIFAAFATLFILRVNEGDNEKALDIADETIERYPERFEGYSNRIALMHLMNLYEEALEFMSQIKVDFTDQPMYIILRSAALRNLNKSEDALNYLNEKRCCFTSDFYTDRYEYERALVLFELNRLDDAIPIFKRMYSEKGDRNAGFMLVVDAVRHKDFDEVLSLCEKLCAPDTPKDSTYINTLVYKSAATKVLHSNAEYRVSLEFIINELNEMGDDITLELMNVRAAALEQLGKYEEAINEYEEICLIIKNFDSDLQMEFAEYLAQVDTKRTELEAKE
jgi:tetratricopeptide (TPR) repeat protein